MQLNPLKFNPNSNIMKLKCHIRVREIQLVIDIDILCMLGIIIPYYKTIQIFGILTGIMKQAQRKHSLKNN